MRKLLVTMFVALLIAGYGESSTSYDPADSSTVTDAPGSPQAIDLDDNETREKIIAEAIDWDKFQWRGEEGEKLAYAPDKQTPYTGWGRGWNDNGELEALTQYKDGKEDGLWTYWYENGQKEAELTYKDGKPDGPSKSWYSNGQKESEENYKDGKIMTAVAWKFNGVKCPVTKVVNGNGVVVVYYQKRQKYALPIATRPEWGGLETEWSERKWQELTYKDGQLDRRWTYWHNNGQKKSEENFKDGGHRFQTEWYRNGQKKSEENSKDGKPDGLQIGWYQNGQKMKEWIYKAGQLDFRTEWYENGQKLIEGNYKDGNLEGLWTSWYDNERKFSEGNHKDGKRDGLWIQYNRDGTKSRQVTYKDGKPDGQFQIPLRFSAFKIIPPPKIPPRFPKPIPKPVSRPRVVSPRSIPTPMKPPILWSDFTYNSPQEKIFWEKAPDWSGIKGITSWFDDLTSSWPATIVINGAISRRDSNGSIIGKDSVQGYTGWAKSINFESKSIVDDYHHRTIYKLENGWVVKSMSWNIVGQKREEATFKDGWPSGSYILWHDNERKKEESRWMWKDGQPFSIPVTAWYENGQKRGEAIYVWESYSEQDRRYRIMRDGLSTSYYENGQKKSEITFKDGEKNGLFTWYRNGRKSWEGRYKNGKWDGLYNEWYENGQKEKESTYKDGKLMTAVAWKFNGEKCPATKVVNGNGVVVVYRDDGTVRHHLTYKHGKDITSPSPVLPAPRKRKRPPLID